MASTPHVEARLEDLVLGTLTADERAEVEAHLGECPACRAAWERLEPAMQPLSEGLEAPAAILDRLEQALRGGGRFAHLRGELERLFDLPGPAVEALLDRVDDEAAWDEGMAPGVKLMMVAAGPRREGWMTALVHLEPGATFPEHEHGDQEEVLVLEGGYTCSTGLEVWRGELDVRQRGTRHAFTALPDAPCLCAAVTRPPES